MLITEETNLQVSKLNTDHKILQWHEPKPLQVFLLLQNPLNPSVNQLLIKILKIAQSKYTELYKFY